MNHEPSSAARPVHVPSQPFSDVTIAAYYYPCLHPHERWDSQKYPGFTEWDLVNTAPSRFPGHVQPRVPLWGCEDDSKPEVMARKIDAAADHGVQVFIFDWYHYDDGPFLEHALDKGFMQAPNNQRIKFALMWANHDWYGIQGYDPREECKLWYPGKITPATWDKITTLIIERYFNHPSYWKIDGCPYFSIYDIQVFLESFGSVASARAALEDFRRKTTTAGFPGLHVNSIIWGQPNLPGGTTPADWPNLCQELKLDSGTGYTWVHHGALDSSTFPITEYTRGRDRYLQVWKESLSKMPMPYFPNTTVAWDNSPRAAHSVPWTEPAPHVVNPVLIHNTPQAFGEATRMILESETFQKLPHKILTVNAWNEWPEGSCLEPDTQHGYGYLEALRDLAS